jgi:hypothetical protein
MHTQVLQLRSKNAAIRVELAALRCILALKAGFDPNQPRVPAGRPEGGQWTDSGNGQSNARRVAEPLSETPEARSQRRKRHVLAGGGALFSVAPNPNADATAPWYERAGRSQVKYYDAEIDQVAARNGNRF